MPETVKLSDYVMRFVADQGVEHLFMLTGGGAMHLNDSAGGCPGLKFVCNLHEQACAVAAESYAKCRNGLGAALVTVGPGATNTITGLAGAWLDSTPVLFLSGQVKRADLKGDSGLRNRGVQEIDIVTLVQSITKYAVTVMDPSMIRFHLEKAIYLARSGRPGPVWIEIPLDVQAARVNPDSLLAYEPEAATRAGPTGGLDAKVRRTIDLLAEAERPLLLLGNGIRLSGALQEARELVERLRFPLGLTWPAMDFVPDDLPLLVGRPGSMAPRGANFALQNADFVLAIGARLDVVCTAFAPDRLARGAKKVMVDIDSAEIDKLQPHLELGILADAGAFLREMLRQLPSRPLPDIGPWADRCRRWKKAYPLVPSGTEPQEGPVSMYSFTRLLCEALPEGALVVPASSGNAVEIFLLAFRAKAGQRVFTTTGLGSMGFGVPACIGACLAQGGRPTVGIEGDGGFQMNAQELETIARLKLPIKLFVINNGGYGSILATQRAYFHRLVGCTPESGLTFPGTLQLAAAYGLETFRIGNQGELGSGIQEVLDSAGPCVCEVMAIADEPRQPRVASYQKPDGSMASRPLEDMYPFLPREEFLANMIVPPLEE
jgi:acetolactate synthase I/II/III large subunit